MKIIVYYNVTFLKEQSNNNIFFNKIKMFFLLCKLNSNKNKFRLNIFKRSLEYLFLFLYKINKI